MLFLSISGRVDSLASNFYPGTTSQGMLIGGWQKWLLWRVSPFESGTIIGTLSLRGFFPVSKVSSNDVEGTAFGVSVRIHVLLFIAFQSKKP